MFDVSESDHTVPEILELNTQTFVKIKKEYFAFY